MKSAQPKIGGDRPTHAARSDWPPNGDIAAGSDGFALVGSVPGVIGARFKRYEFDRADYRSARSTALHRAMARLKEYPATLHFVSLPMFIADLFAMIFTCVFGYLVAANLTGFHIGDVPTVFVALFVPIAIGNLLTGLYPGAGLNPVVEFRQLSRVAAISFLGTFSLACFSRLSAGWYLFFAIAWLCQFFNAPLARAAMRKMVRHSKYWGYPVIVFGAGKAATLVVMNLLQHPEYGLRPVVVLDSTADTLSVLGIPVAGKPRLASTIARRLKLRYAIVALPDLTRTQVTRVLERYAQGIRHVMITSAISPFAPGLPILWRDTRDLAGIAGVEVRNRLLVTAPRVIKRSMDLVLTVSGGICLSPFLALIALLVKCSSRGPIFYGHQRIGHKGQAFCAWKFRSMKINSDRILEDHLMRNPELRDEWERDRKLKNDPRVTRFGALLRKTSLDELPQLWNVLCGQMSLVGPRPIVRDEVEKYGKFYSIYKAVRPGMTGLWQVSGRNDTTYAERLALDEYYVRNWSPWLDIHLLARTVAVVLARSGAY